VIRLDLTALIKIGTTLVAVAGLAQGGYSAMKEYDLMILNSKISRCEIAELRLYVLKKEPMKNECWKIALER